MKVLYEPDSPTPTGVVSHLTWNHPDLHEALKQAFGVRKCEKLVRVEVTRDGLKACFEPVPRFAQAEGESK